MSTPNSLDLTTEQTSQANIETPAQPTTQMRVLVVDDSRMQRKILSSALTRWGYAVTQASSGTEALAICQTGGIDMVISDWVMPEMDGLDFCKAFRKMDRAGYGYFILLTSKAEASEIAVGLDAGADDFLTKPVSFGELRARLRAGERILKMQFELIEKNLVVTQSLSKIKAMNEALESDLKNARILQTSLLPETFLDIGTAETSLLFQPCGHVGGDLVGQFTIDERTIGLFSLDVSGHGVTSALMTARLSSYLSGGESSHNIAVKKTKDGWIARAPAETAQLLNDILINELKTEQYFTMALAIIDLYSGKMQFVQAGHPHPILQKHNGEIKLLGDGGIPIGLIPGAEYEDIELTLDPGDRLLLYSDGVTESQNAGGQLLDENGLIRIVKSNAKSRGPEFATDLLWEVQSFSGTQEQADDISALVFDFKAYKSIEGNL